MADKRKAQGAPCRKNRRANGEWIRPLFFESPIPLAVTERETGLFHEVNDEFASASGYARDELIGRRSLDIGIWAYPEERRSVAADPPDPPSASRSGRIHLRRKDGSIRTFFIASKAIRDDGRDLLLSVCYDIEEMVQTEARLLQSQKIEAIGRLAGGIAHDFNNLLTPIIGYAEMLLMSTPAQDARHRKLREILHAGDKARRLTQRLLVFSRKQIFELKPLELNEVLVRFQQILRRAVRENVDLQFALSKPPCFLLGDASQLELALMNLVVNAQDAMSAGGRILIETAVVELDQAFCNRHPPTPPGAYVMLSVGDNGCGMSEEVQKHLFEPFFTTKQAGQGTGLGLASVYGIAKQHRGFVWVESEAGKGSIFRIYLPRLEGTGEIPASEPGSAPPFPRGQETILIAEDNKTVRQLARDILTRAGYNVLAPATIGECRSLMAKQGDRIDLLLSDVVMPRTSGPQLYREFSSFRPRLKVLYMSGYTESVIAEHGVLKEGVDFIAKPLGFHALANKVREVLDRPLPGRAPAKKKKSSPGGEKPGKRSRA